MSETTGIPGHEDPQGIDPALIRKIVIGVVIALVVAFGYMLWRAVEDEGRLGNWDTLEALRVKHEPAQDPLWENPYGVYNDERKKYIGALQAFLAGEAKDSDDALTPHTRFVLAKTIADHILANPGVLDQEERAEWYKQATEQLAKIRDDHPNFPLNWTMLSQDGFASLTRRFIDWLEKNKAWEEQYMLRPMDVDAGTRMLIRTDRGDMLMGIYSEHAPKWTAALLERAMRGAYDGTYFVEKRDAGDASEPGEHGFRSGGEPSRGMGPYDTATAIEAAGTTVRASELPEEARNRIPFDRGIVAAWHDGAEQYDTPDLLFVVTSRSPFLDYKYTPVGKLVDEGGVNSLMTADRIFGGDVWRDDAKVREDGGERPPLDWLQVPVRIIKVLVYKDGKLQEPSGDAAPGRAAPDDSERSLSSIKADRYKTDVPVRPVDTPKKDEDDKGDTDTKGEPKKDE